jgi:RNA polymerase sigma-70 factor, ECF subfamily
VAEQRARIATYLGRLNGYAISLTGDRDRARDLVQDCALRAIAARRYPADEPAYRAWLFRILRNAFLDEERRAGRSVELNGIEEPVEKNGGIWRFDESLISGLTVRIGLTKLSPPHREVIALVDLAGFSYDETAALIGVPSGTVMSRLSRARQCLLLAIGESNVQPLPTPARKAAT